MKKEVSNWSKYWNLNSRTSSEGADSILCSIRDQFSYKKMSYYTIVIQIFKKIYIWIYQVSSILSEK